MTTEEERRRDKVDDALERLVDLNSDLKILINVLSTKVSALEENNRTIDAFLERKRDEYERYVLAINDRFSKLIADRDNYISKTREELNKIISDSTIPIETEIDRLQKYLYIGWGIWLTITSIVGFGLVFFEGTGLQLLHIAH